MTPGWPASRSAGTDQTRFPDPRHMHGVWDLLERGGATWFGMLLGYNKEKCITPNKCGLKSFSSFSSPSTVLQVMTSQHTGSKAPWEQRQTRGKTRRQCQAHWGSGVTRTLKSATTVK